MRIIHFLSFLAVAAAQGCSSVSGISHTSNGCAVGEGNPDCAFIQANSAAICAAILPSWEIVNGPAGACNLRGTSYGCIYAAGAFSTTDTFCCALGPAAAATATASSSVSGSSSPSPSASPSVTPSPSPSPSASPSVTPSPAPSATPSSSASPSGTVSPSASPSGTVSPSASPSASPSGTVSPSGTASATHNLTLYNFTSITTNQSSSAETLSAGAAGGIGVAVAIVLFLCCGAFFFRRRPADKMPLPIERRKSVVEEKDRRPSMVIRTAV